MICTEEEAREKWCPHTRETISTYDGNPIGSGNNTGGPGDCSCIGSKCMMWVWFDDDQGSCGLSRG